MKYSIFIRGFVNSFIRLSKQKLLHPYCLFFLLLLQFPFYTSNGQEAEITMEKIPLTWNNFLKKDYKSTTIPSAKTSIDFGLKWHLLQKSKHTALLTIQLSASFNSVKSYVSSIFLQKADSTERTELLNHEKGHWVISTIYLKKLANTLDSFPFNRQVRQEIDSISKVNSEERNNLQLQYDATTNYSQNKEEQIRWEKELLDKLNGLYQEALTSPDISTIIKRTIKW